MPRLAGLKFNIVPEAATRQLGVQSGVYRMVPSLDAATAGALAGQSRVKVLQTQDLAYSVVGLNTSKPPFDKPEVREAVNLALDRTQLAEAAYFGKAVPAGPLSPALKDWALPVSEFPCYRSDAGPRPQAAAGRRADNCRSRSRSTSWAACSRWWTWPRSCRRRWTRPGSRSR